MGDGSYRLSAAVCAMPASDADKLIAAGSGDCALLYIYLLRCGPAPDEELCRALGMDAGRLAAVAGKLRSLGLLATGAQRLPPAQELPQYTSEEVVRRTGEDPAFRGVQVIGGNIATRSGAQAMIDAGVLDGANFDADTFNADTWKEGISFRQYDDYPAISTALSANEIQGFCVDKSILAIYKTDGRSYVDAEFSPQEYGIATKKGSDFSALCDELVQGWLADGTVESLIKENGLS